MKIARRIVALVMALLMVTTSLTVTAFAAAGSAGMVVTTSGKSLTELNAGDTVTVKITLPAMDKLVAAEICLNFDKSKFEYQDKFEYSEDDGEEIEVISTGFNSSWAPTITTKENANAKGTVQFNAGGLKNRKVADGFNLLTVEFKVRNDVSGTADFELSLFNLSYWDEDAKVSVHITDVTAPAAQSVTIKGAHVHAYTKVDAVDATCVKDGNIAYYTCTCGKYFKLDGAKYVEISKADTVISKSTAAHKLTHVDAVVPTNCSTDAVAEHWKCTVCGKLFTDAAGNTETTLAKLTTPAAHKLSLITQKNATCTEDGMKAHYQCSACGKLFTDMDGKNETTADALKIPAAHKLSLIAQKNATCTEDGMKAHYQCSVCKKLFTDEDGKNVTNEAALKIPAAHNIVAVTKKDATCTEDGYEAHYKCTVCKKLFSDQDGKKQIDEPVAIKAAHKLVKVDAKPSTCLAEGWNEYYKCSVCGKLFSDAAGATGIAKVPTLPLADHTPGTGYAYDGTNHWQFCTVCGEKLNVTKHTPDIEEPTEDQAQRCKVCDAVLKNATGDAEHTHGILDGWKFDDNYHWHACRMCNEQLDKAAHRFGSWVIDKEATTTTTGLRHAKCDDCGYVKQEVIAKKNPSQPGGGSSTTDKPVESQKTFDAGIALYAGMAVLSLTGGAWMIGKKKKEH